MQHLLNKWIDNRSLENVKTTTIRLCFQIKGVNDPVG